MASRIRQEGLSEAITGVGRIRRRLIMEGDLYMHCASSQCRPRLPNGSRIRRVDGVEALNGHLRTPAPLDRKYFFQRLS